MSNERPNFVEREIFFNITNETVAQYLEQKRQRDMEMAELLLGIDAMPIEISLLILGFIFLFVVGFFGNVTVIYRIIRTNRQCLQIYGKSGNRRITMQKYVLLLAVVDLIVTTMILMLIPYLIYGEWLFGAVMCKVFWSIDQLNRIFSVHILTGMAIERYFIVRESVLCRRSAAPRLATVLFFCTTLVTVILIGPLLTYVQIDERVMPPGINVTSCISPMPDIVFESVCVYMMSLSYIVPALIVTFCYVSLVCMLRRRYRLTNTVDKSKTRLVHKVSKSILYVTVFHFACWTPYWVVSILPIIDHRIWQIGLHKRFASWATIQFYITMLPYVNSSFNWCFYVLLNQRLRKQIFRRSTTHTSCHTNKNRDDHSPIFGNPEHL